MLDDKTVAYGRHSSFVGILATILSSLDSPVLFHYLGTEELALYTFAMAPVAQIQGLTKRIPTLATPKMSQWDAVKIDSMLKKRAFFLFIIGLFIAAVYTLFARCFFDIFFPEYLDAVWYSQLFSLSVPVSMAHSIISPAVSSKLTLIPKKMLFLWNIPGAVYSFALFILVVRFGVAGVVASRLLSTLSSFTVVCWLWHKVKDEERKILFQKDA